MNIWIYDQNHRSYVDDNGNRYNTPIYRKSFVKCEVVGETKQSWIVDTWKLKVPKNPEKRRFGVYAFSEEELDQLVYVHDHALNISQHVRNANYDQLRQIAKVIGYSDAE